MLALVTLGLGSPHGARAFCRLTTEAPSPAEVCSGEGIALHWDRSCISYSLLDREVADPPFDAVRDAVDRAFGSWEAVECEGGPVGLSLRQTEELTRCSVPEHSPAAGNSNSVLFLADWRSRGLPSDAFGLTLIWHSPDTGEIFDADMQLNETMGTFGICEQRCPEGVVDLENVVTHEAGHFLGLGHSAVPTAAMYGESRVGEVRKRILDSDDQQGVCAVFGGDPELRCERSDYTPRGGLDPQCYEPTQQCSAGRPGSRGAGDAAVLLLGALLALVWRRRR